MTLLTVLSLLGILIFGAVAVYLSIREERAQKLLQEREDLQKQRVYELSILREIQERIGYELDIEKVADVITGSLGNLFSYSTTSSLLLKQDTLIFKTYAQQQVSHTFVGQVKNTVIASLGALIDTPIPQHIQEITSGLVLDDTNTLPVGSFFNIPLIIDNEVVGLINISSTKPGLYKENQMTILYQITNVASTAITRLHQVLDSEKGKLTAMISSLADGVFMVNTKKQMQTMNTTAKTMLGITKEEPSMIDVAQAIGQNFDLSSMLDDVLSTQKEAPLKEIFIRGKNIQLFVTPVKDSTKQILLGASVLLHDITLEKNLSQMKDDFTNMVVHELRAPLTAIRGASALMQKEKKNLTEEEQEKLLTITTDQSTRLLNLVGSILDASKLEAGKLTLFKVPTDMKKAAESSLALFQAQATTKHIVTSLLCEDTLPQVSLDPVRFGEVMNNILSNSLKFTPEGGNITISIKKINNVILSETKDLDSSAKLQNDNNNFLQISIADTGIGIPKEKQTNLFSKFYQVQHSKEDLQYITKGTGLGLYIVKAIVEAHGGSVTLTSSPGQGTTVTCSFPLTASTQTTTDIVSTPLHRTLN